MLVEQFIDQIVELITSSLLAGIGLAPVALALTQLVKFLPVFENVPAKSINAVVVIVVFIVASGMQYFGHFEQFTDVFEIVSAIVLSLAGVAGGSSGLYRGLNYLDAPLIGAERGE